MLSAEAIFLCVTNETNTPIQIITQRKIATGNKRLLLNGIALARPNRFIRAGNDLCSK
jgi:hypothetical protein